MNEYTYSNENSLYWFLFKKELSSIRCDIYRMMNISNRNKMTALYFHNSTNKLRSDIDFFLSLYSNSTDRKYSQKIKEFIKDVKTIVGKCDEFDHLLRKLIINFQ